MTATAKDISDAVKLRLQRTRQAGIDDLIISELNRAMRKCEKRAFLPWFLGKVVSSNPGAGSVYLPDLVPDNFLRDYEDPSLEVRPDGSTEFLPCIKVDYDVMQQQTALTTYGTYYYSLTGDTIFVKPYVLTGLSFFKYSYYGASAPIVTLEDTNEWIEQAETLMIGEVGEAVAIGLSSPKISYFTQLKAEAYDELRKFHTARTEGSVRRIMGGTL